MPGIDEHELEAQIEREKLHNALICSFDLIELKILCVVLGIRPEDVVNDHLTESVFRLVEYCLHRSMLVDLVAYLVRKRPHIQLFDLLQAGANFASYPSVLCEFVNRANEVDLVCAPSAPRFIVVDAPAGYGKTYFLYRIRARYEDERVKWRAGYVDLKPDPIMRHTEWKRALPCILNSLMASFGSLATGALIPAGASFEAMSLRLAAFLTGQLRDSPGVLLLWDGIEVLPDETSTKLQQLMFELYESLQNVGKTLVVIFSGRYVSDWGSGVYEFPLRILALTPFDYSVVRDMILGRAALLGVTPPKDEYLDNLTWNVLYLSGGHPHSICCLVDQIARYHFVFPNLHYAFFEDNQHQYGAHHGTFFQTCIEPIIQVLSADLSPWLQAVFLRLSPVRRYSPAILDHFMLEHLIPTPPVLHNGWGLMRAMEQTHLVRPPIMSDPMYSDQIVRRMLAVKLRLTAPEDYACINAAAESLFDGWASQRSLVERQVWCTSVIESLYHTLQAVPEVGARAELQGRVLRKVKAYLEQAIELSDLHQLRDALRRDEELRDLLKRYTGADTFRRILLDIQAAVQRFEQVSIAP
jgi:hypothetical protein